MLLTGSILSQKRKIVNIFEQFVCKSIPELNENKPF